MPLQKTTQTSLIFYFAILALAFCIPLYNAFTPMLVSLLFVFFLIDGKFKEKFKSLFAFHTLVLVLIFFLYLIGVVFSTNMDYAAKDVVLKLPFLLFPLLLFSLKNVFTESRIANVLKVFVVACAITTLVCLVNAICNYARSKDLFVFYYVRLSPYIHPSYFAMYLNFAIIVAASFLIKNDFKIAKLAFWGLTGLIFYFSVFVILLNSKAGMLFLSFIFLTGLIYLLSRKKYLSTVVILAVSLTSLYVIKKYFAGITNRVESAVTVVMNTDKIEKTAGDGTSDRILIWQAASELIADNFWVGVGTGDVKDVLLEKYYEKGIALPFTKKLNAHNQFLQTFVALGVLGILALLALFVYPMVFAIKQKKYTYVFFLLLVLINFLFESMLERQAGVMFFAFFNTLLFVDLKKN